MSRDCSHGLWKQILVIPKPANSLTHNTNRLLAQLIHNGLPYLSVDEYGGKNIDCNVKKISLNGSTRITTFYGIWFVCYTTNNSSALYIELPLIKFLLSKFQWWRHQMQTFFRVTGRFCREFTGHQWIPLTKPVTRSFDVFFDLRLDKRLSIQSRGWWFETPSCSLWRHCNANRCFIYKVIFLTTGEHMRICYAYTHTSLKYTYLYKFTTRKTQL